MNAHSTETFLRYLLSLSTELALTPQNLVRDFGENSSTARQVVPAIYNALKGTTSPKVRTLFRQWQRQFREVSGYEAEGGQLDAAALARLYAIRDPELDLERLFFALHSYYAAFIKLLALLVAHHYLRPNVETRLGAAANLDGDKLRRYLEDLERGGLFAQLGIHNFLEGDFFGWYLDVWDDSMDAALRRLIRELSGYSLLTLDVDPEETRDLLKQLYQNLMPKKLRHALGEYYTPDWLAERVLNQLGYEGDPRKRLLDPACGSGTFLVLALKRIRRYAEQHRLRPEPVLEQALQNVVGYDLNPLAVVTARTNYLLALGDLLQRHGEITVPVYLADSILTPSMDTSQTGQLSFLDGKSATRVRQPGYGFNTSVGRFVVPRTLVEARYIDQLADLLEESVRNGLTGTQFRQRLLDVFPFDQARDATDLGIAVQLYEQLQDLDRQHINGIWARIIKNAFAPLFQGRFDYIAGNPPWVNWESLPADYRQETKPLWVHHNLFPHTGMDTILGKGKKDISMLLTFVAADNYLKDGCRLGFIITQSVLKTSGAGQGFRRFLLGSGTPVAVAQVDDLVDLQPFEGATNRTAVLVLQRGAATKYPLTRYYLWRKSVKGRRVSEDASIDEVLAMSTVSRLAARPVEAGDVTSPWITGKPRALLAVDKVLGKSHYGAKAGVCTWLNGVYWVEVLSSRPDGQVVVSNLTEGGKTEVEAVQAAMEPDLLYPLLRGRDVARWSASPQAYIVMVQDRAERRGLDESRLAVDCPKTYGYLKRFERQLRARSGYRRYFDAKDPFYSIFNVGDYTFAPYKVVWREQANSLMAAVASGQERCVVPDHKLMMVPFHDEQAAHYLCSALNSSPAQFVVASYAINIQMDTHILVHVRVPAFDAGQVVHQRMAEASKEAHGATAAADVARVREIEAEIDTLGAQLWGLTPAELKEIQESLEELA